MPQVTSIDPVLRWLRGGPPPRLDARAIRTRVAELLSEGLLRDDDASAVVMAFERCGTDGVVAPLRRFVKDAGDAPLREAVRIVLAARRVGAEPGRSFVDTAVDGMRSLLATAAGDPSVARMLVDQGLDAGLPPEALLGMFAAMTAADRLPVGSLLGAVVASPRMAAVHVEAVRRFANAASPADAAQFHALAREAQDPEVARAMREAALRLGTSAIEGVEEAAHDVEAWVSTCDGLGAFRVVVRAPVGAGRYSVHVAVVRAHQGLRDLYTFPCRDEDDSDELLYELAGDGAPEVAVSPGVAMGLVEAALVDGVRLEPDEEVVLASLRRVCGPPESIEDPRPEGRFDAKNLEATVASLCLTTWFFDDGDLGERPPSRRTVAWKKERAAGLSEGLRARVVAICQHMARFCHLAEDPVGAGRFARAAVDVGQGKDSVVTLHLIGHAQVIAPSADRWRLELREHLRGLGFANLRTPRNIDLAALDLAEQAHLAMDRLWAAVPGERVLRERDQQRLALAVGRAASVPFGQKAGRAAIDAAIQAASVELGDLAPALAAELLRFMDEVCATCPVGCANRPEKAAGRMFFRERHPAFEA